MGFFDLRAICAICNKEIGLNRSQLSKDVWICPSCLKKLGGVFALPTLQQMTVDEIKEKLNTANNNLTNFTFTKKIGNYIYFDDKHKKFAIPQGIFSKKLDGNKIFSYDSILNYELLEDGNTISKGGVGRAIVGGALFGGVGALVGATTGHKSKKTCTRLQIKITLNNTFNPVEFIDLISTETKTNSIFYKSAFDNAQEILSMLNIICQTNNNQNIKENFNISAADEIKKYKELLDIGAITQAEYEEKKKQLLNL